MKCAHRGRNGARPTPLPRDAETITQRAHTESARKLVEAFISVQEFAFKKASLVGTLAVCKSLRMERGGQALGRATVQPMCALKFYNGDFCREFGSGD